jgi:hypothetical protein
LTGSPAIQSSPAPEILPLRIAFINALLSTSSPRALLIRIAPF